MTVLVVGAGPTGLVAALGLAVNGVPCLVIDRRDGPSSSSRALGLQARSMELLDRFGLSESIRSVSYELSGASIMEGAREVARQPRIRPPSPFPHTYVAGQGSLEAIVRERLAGLGITIEWGCELQDLVGYENRATATFAHGPPVDFDWVIGADGARSRVRETLGIEFAGDTTGETYFLADFTPGEELSIEHSAMWLGPEGPLMLMQLPDHRWRLFVDVTDRGRRSELPLPTTEVLQDIVDGRAFGPGRLIVGEPSWTSTFHTRMCVAAAYRRGRVFLAGDSVHVFPPFGGQGMNLGIQDAVNLTWKLARVANGRAAPELLDSYQHERRRVAQATIREVEGRRKLFALRNPVARGARDLMLRTLAGNSWFARRASVANSQLDVSYRSDRRLRLRLPGAGPQVGDRAPDAALAGRRLQQCFGPTRFTLLRFVPDRFAVTRPPGDLPTEDLVTEDLVTVQIDRSVDPTGAAVRSYRMSAGGLVLVRPDGYLGYRGTDPAAARAAMSRPTDDL